MKVVGQTVDGEAVWAGLYDLYQTHGVPMSLTLSRLPGVPSWTHEVAAMRTHGMADCSILAFLSEVIDDSTLPLSWGEGAKERLKGML